MKRLPVLVMLGVAVLPRPAFAAELTAAEIVERALERNAFGFEQALARMTLVITNKRGNEQRREVEIRSAKKNDLGRTLVRFHAPADVAGTGFLILENQGRDDDQYLYLPALGKVKRITGSQRDQKFMGTDLTYADMESRNLRQSENKRLANSKVGGNDTYVIESIPKSGETTQYGRTVSHIHTVSFVPLKIEFYDKENVLLKTLTVRRLEKKQERWVVMDSLIENVQQGTKTQSLVNQLDLDAKIPDEDFTEKALQAG